MRAFCVHVIFHSFLFSFSDFEVSFGRWIDALHYCSALFICVTRDQHAGVVLVELCELFFCLDPEPDIQLRA
jgi:hypothetical protein